MSILGNITEGISKFAGQTELLATLSSVIEQQGGIDALLKKFNDQGLGDVVKSWANNDQAQALSSEALKSLLGSESLNHLTGKLGLTPDEVAAKVSQMLPGIMSKLS